MQRHNADFEIRRQGNILDEDVEALVNTVNCVGVMGRGIALQFKNAYPDNFREYSDACKRNDVRPGRMFVYKNHASRNPRYVINFPTKRHWRVDSRLEDVELGLKDLKKNIREHNIRSIAIPPLGCGLGGLAWADVYKCIVTRLSPLKDTRIVLFEPDLSNPSRPTRQKSVPEMNTGRAALIVLMQRYLNGLLDPTISLLEIHKLMYFLYAAGAPDIQKLKYVKSHYGPYATNLSQVLKAVEGYFILGYKDGGDQPDKEISLVPGAVEDANHYLQHRTATRSHIRRVIRLVSGFETSFGLELLATVYWVLTNDKIASNEDLIESTYTWNERKRRFTTRQIVLAASKLADEGWLAKNIVEKLDIGYPAMWIQQIPRKFTNFAKSWIDSVNPEDLTKAS